MPSHLSEMIGKGAKLLPPITDKGFASYFDFLGSSCIVLLGDASHGTSEFYHARAEITKRLVEHHGFNTIALEADWPDAESLDRYVRQRPGPQTKMETDIPDGVPFKRFPTWMWRNREMQDLVHWLRDRNAALPMAERAGLFGLDLYSLGVSLGAVIQYLDHVDPEMAQKARRRYACMQPYAEEPSGYGLASLMSPEFKDCETKVTSMLRDLMKKRLDYASAQDDTEEFHSAEQNARLVADAERYYKSMYYRDDPSWNLRDRHMFETLARLIKFRGGKVVVWAHNSHLGDARYTGMSKRGELNLGQLCREVFGDQVAILGCGTHTGTVAAAHNWGGDMEVMNVVPSRPDSWERQAHDTGFRSFVLNIREASKNDESLKEELMKQKLERFIGVIYRPDTELQSHYSSAVLGKQLDAYLWFDESRAVQALEKTQPRTPLAQGETYPFGL
jgi:erythromycin esterase-like protein